MPVTLALPRSVARIWRNTSSLLRDDAATAMLEFALAMPFLLTIGLLGTEAANRAVVQMRINQLAVLVADNASRVGENSLLGEVKLYESDINDIFMGAKIQAGDHYELFENGRVILSSLEVLKGTEDQQYIHWQRCMGKLNHTSSYGEEGDGEFSNIAGMGPKGEEIYTFKGEAVMFVEIAYTYTPIVSDLFDNTSMSAIAAFNVRNNRDLTGVKQRDEGKPDPVSTCDKFEAI